LDETAVPFDFDPNGPNKPIHPKTMHATRSSLHLKYKRKEKRSLYDMYNKYESRCGIIIQKNKVPAGIEENIINIFALHFVRLQTSSKYYVPCFETENSNSCYGGHKRRLELNI
jgi:hypothetical protein